MSAVVRAKSTRMAGQNEETRQRLLRAASEVFVEHGFHGATVREICHRAKVNLALVNYYFGDKLELYTEVLRSAMKDPERLREMRDLFAQTDKPEIVLRKFIHALLRLMIHRRQSGAIHMQLMLHELARPTTATARVVDETVKPMHNRLRLLVGQILGLPASHSKTRLCTQSIIGQTIHYAHHSPVISRLWPELTMTPKQQEMVADHIADFSLSYLKSFGLKTRKAAK